MNKLLDRARIGVVIAAALVVCDCNLVLGVDDWQYDRAAGGAGASIPGGGAPSSGGSGGQSGVLHAADWSTSLDALYLFENVPPDLGEDASGHGHDLTIVGDPELDHASFQEGEFSVVLDGDVGNGFDSVDPVFASPAGTVMTYGGWFRMDSDGQDAVFVRHDNSDGYRLAREGGKVSCLAEAENSAFATAFSDRAWTGDWVHLVCRLDDTDVLSTLVDGSVSGGAVTDVVIGDEGATEVDGPEPHLQIAVGQYGDSDIQYRGRADEVFYVRSALSNASIKRIWACGVAGKRCACDPDAPSDYLDCGRAAGSCTSLPACDAPLE